MILVTGGCGYIGSHIVKQLSSLDRPVMVVDNLVTGFSDALLSNETLVQADVGDKDALDRVFSTYKIDAVIHMAASVVVSESVSNPLKYYRNNTANILNLLQTMEKHRVTKLVFSSTAAVYGHAAGNVVEEDPLAPLSPYGYSKLMSEQIIRDWAKASGTDFVILRYFNVAGASADGRIGQRTVGATHLVKVASEVACGKRDQLLVYGEDYDTPDGTCVRDYIHVEDLADIHITALDLLAREGGRHTFNCGYGRGLSVLEVIRSFEKVLGRPLPVQMAERRPGDVAQIVANSEKFARMTGWKPCFDNIETIIRTAYEFEKTIS